MAVQYGPGWLLKKNTIRPPNKLHLKEARIPDIISDFNKGNMILADELILANDGAKNLYLIEPDPTAFKAIA